MKVTAVNEPNPERMREFKRRLAEIVERRLREERKQAKNKEARNERKDQ
jgi:hypothetical protein